MIRRATPADAEALIAVQVRSWKRAYADFLPEAAVTLEAVAERERRWRTGLAERGWNAFVYDLDGRVAAFAAVGASRDEDEAGPVGALEAIYVDPPAQGAGVGRELMAAAERWLTAGGFAEATLWCFTANGLAREFYERRGWTLDAPEAIERAHGTDWWAPAVRYRLALAPLPRTDSP